jgi:hypothetical protein
MGRPDVFEYENFTGLDLRSGLEVTAPTATIACSNIYLTTGQDYVTRPPLHKVSDLDPNSFGLYVVGDTLRSTIAWQAASAPDDVPGVLRYDILRGGTLPASSIVGVSDWTSWKGQAFLSMQMQLSGENYFAYHLTPSAARATIPCTVTSGSTSVPGLPAPLAAGGYPVKFVGVGTGYTATYRVTAAGVITPAWPGATNAACSAILYDDADTAVVTPFSPGSSVRVAAEKIFTTTSDDNTVPFSATGSATDWVTLNDAGFLPTNTHIDGDQPINGLGVFNGRLLVMAKRAMQMWNVDPDPAQMSLASNIGGSGCDFPRTVANAGGDIFLFATGQFRSVSAIITTGQPKDGDIGAMIRPQTHDITRANSTYEMIGIWWAELQLYLGIQGQTVYCYTNSPHAQTEGWTNWTLPFPVVNAAIWNGKLYVRRPARTEGVTTYPPELWVFDPESEDYTTEPGTFSWFVRAAWNKLDKTRRMKLIRQIVVPQEGNSSLRLYFQPGDDTAYQDVGDITGTSTGSGRIVTMSMGQIISTEFSGNGYWRLGAFSIYFEAGNLQ